MNNAEPFFFQDGPTTGRKLNAVDVQFGVGAMRKDPVHRFDKVSCTGGRLQDRTRGQIDVMDLLGNAFCHLFSQIIGRRKIVNRIFVHSRFPPVFEFRTYCSFDFAVICSKYYSPVKVMFQCVATLLPARGRYLYLSPSSTARLLPKKKSSHLKQVTAVTAGFQLLSI